MVNCLAFSLGIPSETNHIYPRIFTPNVLDKTFGPGSDHHRNNYDCGYQLNNGQLTNNANPTIMGNNRLYRLALNSLVWGALSWCTLLGNFLRNFLHLFFIYLFYIFKILK